MGVLTKFSKGCLKGGKLFGKGHITVVIVVLHKGHILILLAQLIQHLCKQSNIPSGTLSKQIGQSDMGWPP